MEIKTKYDVGQSVYVVKIRQKFWKNRKAVICVLEMGKLDMDHTAYNVRNVKEKEN